MKHYLIKLEQASEPKGIATAAVRSCIACGTMLCGMGGGPIFICEHCWHKLESGQMQEYFRRELEKETMDKEFRRT